MTVLLFTLRWVGRFTPSGAYFLVYRWKVWGEEGWGDVWKKAMVLPSSLALLHFEFSSVKQTKQSVLTLKECRGSEEGADVEMRCGNWGKEKLNIVLFGYLFVYLILLQNQSIWMCVFQCVCTSSWIRWVGSQPAVCCLFFQRRQLHSICIDLGLTSPIPPLILTMPLAVLPSPFVSQNSINCQPDLAFSVNSISVYVCARGNKILCLCMFDRCYRLPGEPASSGSDPKRSCDLQDCPYAESWWRLPGQLQVH